MSYPRNPFWYKDSAGNVLTCTRMEVGTNHIAECQGIVKPTDTDAGYIVGSLFQHTDGGDNTSVSLNEGTTTSANFNEVTAA